MEHTQILMFLICFVPLQLQVDNEANKTILWQNPRPSSTRYCRPIKIMFAKETTELSNKEKTNIENQIKVLLPTAIKVDGETIFVKQKLIMSMIDGKICSSITDTSIQRCNVCKASPTEMNNIITVQSEKPVDFTTYKFGLSTLHAWIQCFECLLHISYRLDVKKWQVRKKSKLNVDARKEEIRRRFRTEMGLLVDIPKPGSGNTNDGNTARRFFQNSSLSSSITGINEELIRRFATILQAMASGYKINSAAFDNYAKETAKLYVDNYAWYYMPSSVHKILIHGADIIKYAILPIGQLSEEAQEARNKDCKRFREHNTRKFSRQNTIEDLFHMLLISSDPIISHHKKLPKKKLESLNKYVLSPLADPFIPGSLQSENSSFEESESESCSLDSD